LIFFSSASRKRAHGFGERVVVPEADIYDFFSPRGALAAGHGAPVKFAVAELTWSVNFTAECVRFYVALKK
jgi:hypothetical protein